MKRGFTLIEALVVLAIFVVLLALLIPAILQAWNQHGWYQEKQVFVAQVVNAREVYENEKTVNRIDIRKATPQPGMTPSDSQGLIASDTVEILNNQNDVYLEKYGSESIQVNMTPGWYTFETVGHRDERWGYFPNVVKVSRIPDPPVAEIETFPGDKK